MKIAERGKSILTIKKKSKAFGTKISKYSESPLPSSVLYERNVGSASKRNYGGRIQKKP